MKSARSTEDEKDAGENTPWLEKKIGEVNINGNNYVVLEFVYAGVKLSDGSYRHENGILPAGDTTYPSLCQVYLKHYANNDDMVAIDGNKNGTLDILVLSQAIQADGWDDANTALEAGFGAATTTNVKTWFEGEDEVNNLPKLITNDAELKAAIEAGQTELKLGDFNFKMPEVNLQGKTLTIIGSKNTVIDMSKVDIRNQFVTGATIEFDGVTLNFGTVNYMGLANTKSLTYKNCTINGLQFLFGENVTFENCDLNSNGAEHCVWTYSAHNVTFTDCDFTYGDRGINCYNDNDVVGGKQTVTSTTAPLLPRMPLLKVPSKLTAASSALVLRSI